MSGPQVLVAPDAETLAAGIAARLLVRLADAVAERGEAHAVLTGGGLGTATLAAVAASPALRSVDWSRVHVWWGDERFVPADSDERNDVGAREALLDVLDLEPAQVHPVAASDGAVGSVDEAAERYASELARHGRGDGRTGTRPAAADPAADVPPFAVVLLGVGPDGHVASLFPGRPGLDVADRSAVGVRDSPKPPPERVSLTLPALCSADEVWCLVSGEGKAEAVQDALSAGSTLPAARVRGRRRTLWLVDREAASRLG